jgi:hypothetical protein
MKIGFVKGCRPWFGIDGCHLNGPYGGVLLSVVAIYRFFSSFIGIAVITC